MSKDNWGYDFDGDGKVSDMEEYLSFNLGSNAGDSLSDDDDDEDD